MVNMTPRTKTMVFRIIYSTVALFLLFLLVASKVPSLGRSITRHHKHYGDLYDLCKVNYFKYEIPDFPWEDTVTLDTVQDAEIICFGDSFVAFNDELFGYQIKAKTGKKTAIVNYASLDNKHRNNPLYMLMALDYHPKGRTVLIWEKVERVVAEEIPQMNPEIEPSDVFGEEKDAGGGKTPPTIPAQSSPIDTISNVILFRQDSLEYCFTNFVGTRWLISYVFTARFSLLGEISDLTSKYTTDPYMLFAYSEVAAYNRKISDGDIKKIADTIERIHDRMDSEYNIEMVFLPIPDKYTVYGDLAGAGPYHGLIPRLTEELNKRSIPAIDLYREFKAYRNRFGTDPLLYYPSDIHWNVEGTALTTRMVIEFLNTKQEDGMGGGR